MNCQASFITSLNVFLNVVAIITIPFYECRLGCITAINS
nr:MAG TPA_asm: hypothetical protein [Caudoviricetes sp.]